MKRALPLMLGIILFNSMLNAQAPIAVSKPQPANTLNYFNATGDGTSIRLQWESSSRNQCDHFNVLRSADGIQYTTIETISADGYNEIATSYNTIDPSPLEGRNYYRLQEIQLDGSSKFGKVIIVGYRSPPKLLVYPNPATTYVQVPVGQRIAGQSAKIRLYSIDGTQIDSRTLRAEDGQQISWNIASLKSGSYFFKLEGEERQLRFIKK